MWYAQSKNGAVPIIDAHWICGVLTGPTILL
jgi:hypothetical protein